MAISDAGSPYTNGNPARSSGAQSVSDVTIPASATHALVSFHWYDNTAANKPSTSTAPTLDGQTCVLIGEVFNGSTGGYNGTQLWRCTGMSAGASKTLTWTNDGLIDDADMGISIGFLAGSDAGAPRSTDTDSAASANTAVTAAMASFSAGDWSVAAYTTDGSAVPPSTTALVAEWTTSGGTAQIYCGIYYDTADGTIATASTADFASIVGAVIIPAAGGGDPEGSLTGGKLIGGGLLIKGVLVP